MLPALIPAVGAQPVAGGAQHHYFYLSDKRIVTVELISRKKVILNYINLGDVIEIIEAPGLLVLDAAGKPYRGHLILNEERIEAEPGLYKATDLIKPGEYRGYDILGKFRFQAPPREVFLRLGSRIIELEAVSAEDFEVIAAKVANLDLTQSNSKLAILDAGFWQGHGKLHNPGSDEAEAIRVHLPDSDPTPPVLIANPAPRSGEAFAGLPDPVVVRLSVRVTALGGVVNPEVIGGINPQLDQQALEVVRNSWEFLPAISKGKPVGAELVLQVVFER